MGCNFKWDVWWKWKISLPMVGSWLLVLVMCLERKEVIFNANSRITFSSSISNFINMKILF